MGLPMSIGERARHAHQLLLSVRMGGSMDGHSGLAIRCTAITTSGTGASARVGFLCVAVAASFTSRDMNMGRRPTLVAETFTSAISATPKSVGWQGYTKADLLPNAIGDGLCVAAHVRCVG
jgi:hypothetical protein